MKETEKRFVDDLSEMSYREMEEFIREKERIRNIVGQIGGKPTMISKVMTILLIVLVLATLIAAPFLPKSLELPAVEVGIVLLSLKIFFFLQNEAKVTHFQFWMLSSLEWRMNEISKRVSKIDENIETLTQYIKKE